MKNKQRDNARGGIIIRDFTGKSEKLVPHLRKTLAISMRELKVHKFRVCLSLIRDAKMKTLNQRYRGVNKSTDVLSFSQESFAPDPKHLGDILISAPTARRQAKAAHRPPADEFSMLAIHGLLHLLGHDHAKKKEAKKMFSLQDRLLKKVK